VRRHDRSAALRRNHYARCRRPSAPPSNIVLVLVEFVDATHSDTDPNRCAHCGKPDLPLTPILPFGVGDRHLWLQRNCWEQWRERRWAEAIAALAEVAVA
jgi:hypothetical protein